MSFFYREQESRKFPIVYTRNGREHFVLADQRDLSPCPDDHEVYTLIAGVAKFPGHFRHAFAIFRDTTVTDRDFRSDMRGALYINHTKTARPIYDLIGDARTARFLVRTKGRMTRDCCDWSPRSFTICPIAESVALIGIHPDLAVDVQTAIYDQDYGERSYENGTFRFSANMDDDGSLLKTKIAIVDDNLGTIEIKGNV